MKILKFGAEWCPGCIIMKPRFLEIEKEFPWLETEYFDVDERQDLVKQYKLEDFPAFIFLDKNGNEFKRLYGEIEKEELIKIIEENSGQ
jgi:thiol-disulfide isomerase/thioredoxin